MPATNRVGAGPRACPENLAAFDSRGTEPDLPFEDVVEDLRQRGKAWEAIEC